MRILTVCSHNRTRSVMMAALLDRMLAERLGSGGVAVSSSGFGAEGLPAIDAATSSMRQRGLDVAGHRSRLTTSGFVDDADLILTAERQHVIRIATLSPLAFARAMTLPEFLDRATDADRPRPDESVRDWVTSLTATRTAAAYVRAAVPEVDDPTGSSRRAFEAAVVAIEQQCLEVAGHLAHWAG